MEFLAEGQQHPQAMEGWLAEQWWGRKCLESLTFPVRGTPKTLRHNWLRLGEKTGGRRLCVSRRRKKPATLGLFIYLVAPSLSYNMWDLVPWLGNGPRLPVWGAWSLNHWTSSFVLECLRIIVLSVIFHNLTHVSLDCVWPSVGPVILDMLVILE